MFRMYRVFLFLLSALLLTSGTMMIQKSADANEQTGTQTEQKEDSKDSSDKGRKLYA